MFPIDYTLLSPDPDDRRPATRLDVQRHALEHEHLVLRSDGATVGQREARHRGASLARSVRRSLGALLIATGERICPEPECGGIEAVRHA